MLEPHLLVIKKFIVHERDTNELQESLLRIKVIMKKFDILENVLKKVDINQSTLILMNLNADCQEVTWIDIILYILKQFHEDIAID